MADIRPMPDIAVEVAFTVGASTSTWLHLDDPTRGKLDVNTLGEGSAEEPVWEDVSAWATEGAITITRRSNRVESPIVQYEPGTATIPLDNSGRRFDPSNLSGPYVDPLTGKTRVTAMRAVRVRAVWAGVNYEMFHGTADGWDVEWNDPGHSVTTLTATDAFKILTGIDRPAVAAVGAGETTGARIGRILDSAGWNADDRDIATGNSTVQATTLEGDVLTELRLAADTEIGELYVDGGGRVVFRNRNALLQDARSAQPQAVFGDDGDELPYLELGQATDDATFYNDVRVTRRSTGEGDEPVEQRVEDTASQAMFYARTFRPETEPIVQTDTDALAYAQWLLGVSSEPELRFTQITIEPQQQPDDLFPQVLGRQIGDRITILRRPPGGGAPIVMDCFIRGIEHAFAEGDWKTTWTLQSADRYGGFLVLDSPTLGQLDNNRLAY